MKAIYNRAKRLKESLQNKYSSMEDTFESRTDKWLESERGTEYYDKMTRVEGFIAEIEQIEFELAEMF